MAKKGKAAKRTPESSAAAKEQRPGSSAAPRATKEVCPHQPKCREYLLKGCKSQCNSVYLACGRCDPNEMAWKDAKNKHNARHKPGFPREEFREVVTAIQENIAFILGKGFEPFEEVRQAQPAALQQPEQGRQERPHCEGRPQAEILEEEQPAPEEPRRDEAAAEPGQPEESPQEAEAAEEQPVWLEQLVPKELREEAAAEQKQPDEFLCRRSRRRAEAARRAEAEAAAEQTQPEELRQEAKKERRSWLEVLVPKEFRDEVGAEKGQPEEFPQEAAREQLWWQELLAQEEELREEAAAEKKQPEEFPQEAARERRPWQELLLPEEFWQELLVPEELPEEAEEQREPDEFPQEEQLWWQELLVPEELPEEAKEESDAEDEIFADLPSFVHYREHLEAMAKATSPSASSTSSGGSALSGSASVASDEPFCHDWGSSAEQPPLADSQGEAGHWQWGQTVEWVQNVVWVPQWVPDEEATPAPPLAPPQWVPDEEAALAPVAPAARPFQTKLGRHYHYGGFCSHGAECLGRTPRSDCFYHYVHDEAL